MGNLANFKRELDDARADADRLAEALRYEATVNGITNHGLEALRQHEGSDSAKQTDRTANVPLKTPQVSPQNGNAPDPEMGSTPDTPSVDAPRVRSTCDCGTVDCAIAALEADNRTDVSGSEEQTTLVVGHAPPFDTIDDGGRV